MSVKNAINNILYEEDKHFPADILEAFFEVFPKLKNNGILRLSSHGKLYIRKCYIDIEIDTVGVITIILSVGTSHVYLDFFFSNICTDVDVTSIKNFCEYTAPNFEIEDPKKTTIENFILIKADIKTFINRQKEMFQNAISWELEYKERKYKRAIGELYKQYKQFTYTMSFIV